ncbi:hypothetical protein A2U01_0066647, partial [Trifolium medium]|nr:hypothetical protein [Trifolium medium]
QQTLHQYQHKET